MNKPWVCIDCGARHDDKGTCATCSTDLLDAREEKVRELMYDVDLRIADKREARLRYLGVGIGMAIVIGLWLVPGYWDVRSTTFALPFLADQWLLMAAIGIGVIKGGQKLFSKRRFPYLNSDQTMS
jgi:hypothetical protein